MQEEEQLVQFPETKGMSIEHFLLLTVVGKGSYAKVVLVKKKDTGQIFAMKIMKKKLIERKRQQQHIMVERNILVGVNHPFIIKMHYSFQNERKLFFALEYCAGGELFNLLQKKKQFNEDQTRFYASQIVLVLEYLHSKDIIYRDLKPENILIDAEGYIKVTDFGLSKMNVKTKNDAHSVCGTPEYLAPEILFKMGHGKAVDWWTLGAILYEMLTGLPPFYTQNRDELFEQIKFGNLAIPAYLSATCKNLIQSLFNKNPEKRLGGKNGAIEIKSHPWFSMINWDAVYNRKLKPPFLPKVKGEIDVTNFDTEFTEQPIESFQDQFASSVHAQYQGFTYQDDKEKKIEIEEEKN